MSHADLPFREDLKTTNGLAGVPPKGAAPVAGPSAPETGDSFLWNEATDDGVAAIPLLKKAFPRPSACFAGLLPAI